MSIEASQSNPNNVSSNGSPSIPSGHPEFKANSVPQGPNTFPGATGPTSSSPNPLAGLAPYLANFEPNTLSAVLRALSLDNPPADDRSADQSKGALSFGNLPQFSGSATEMFRAESHVRNIEAEAKLRKLPLNSKTDDRIILMFGKSLGCGSGNQMSYNDGHDDRLSYQADNVTMLFGREFSTGSVATIWFDQAMTAWTAQYKTDSARAFEVNRMIQAKLNAGAQPTKEEIDLSDIEGQTPLPFDDHAMCV